MTRKRKNFKALWKLSLAHRLCFNTHGAEKVAALAVHGKTVEVYLTLKVAKVNKVVLNRA